MNLNYSTKHRNLPGKCVFSLTEIFFCCVMWFLAGLAQPSELKAQEAIIEITGMSSLDPASPDEPLYINALLTNKSQINFKGELKCEVLDYWFRPSHFKIDVDLSPNEKKDVKVEFDKETRLRLFNARYNAGANLIEVNLFLKRSKAIVAQQKKYFTFKRKIKDFGMLDALNDNPVYDDPIYGKIKLVDEIECFNANDPHPYMEGGRGLGSKYTGAVPQLEWKNIYREKQKNFTEVEDILDRKCRVTKGWGWFGYKFNREGLKPGTPYLLEIVYPEDKPRTCGIDNGGSLTGIGSYGGFHTGRTLGDQWTRKIISEYTDFPLSGKYRTWRSVFYLAKKTRTLASGLVYGESTKDGFWVFVLGVGPSMDPLSEGAAVSSIKLYEVQDIKKSFLKVNEPPRETGSREVFKTYESSRISDITNQAPLTRSLKNTFNPVNYNIHSSEVLYDAKIMGMTGVAPNYFAPHIPLFEDHYVPLLKKIEEERLGLKIFPRLLHERNLFTDLNTSIENAAVGTDGEIIGDTAYDLGAKTPYPDITREMTRKDAVFTLINKLSPFYAYPEFHGVMLFRHHGKPIAVSFSEYAMKLFEEDTGLTISGYSVVERRKWLLDNKKDEYYQWWYKKRRDLLLSIRDSLTLMKDDLKLHYFPWHGDDGYFQGRLRYQGLPFLDKLYVPGTNILLEPSFTIPYEKWSDAQKKMPVRVRGYYREKISPELQGKITMEDIVAGRHGEKKEFWWEPRKEDLPHLAYLKDMDLVKMASEPGSIYRAGFIGCSPELYRNEKDIVYWAIAHYRGMVENSEYLNFFRTGDGVAVCNHFAYNEESFYRNIPYTFTVPPIEHAGPFCMMEEVYAMANADPTYLMESSFQPMKRGFPEQVRRFTAAYRALPTVKSEILKDAVSAIADKDVVVRKYDTDYGVYLAVINKSLDLKVNTVLVTVPVATEKIEYIIDLVTGKKVKYHRTADKKVAFKTTLEPVSMKSFRMVSKIPAKAFRDIVLSSKNISPNNDQEKDSLKVEAKTVRQVINGTWSAQIEDERGDIVREFNGDIPDVEFAWDGKDRKDRVVPDGIYRVKLISSNFPKSEVIKKVWVDTQPPYRARITLDRKESSLNHAVLTGRVDGLDESVIMSLKYADGEIFVPIFKDGTFYANIEGLNDGKNVLSFILKDMAGNKALVEKQFNFKLNKNNAMKFDFGPGPVMEGFNVMRNGTYYSAERGYGWMKYYNLWAGGDRKVGNRLLRDKCASQGRDDTEWAIRLPNRAYIVSIVVSDPRYGDSVPDIYIEGKKMVKYQQTPGKKPFEARFEVELKDEVMNFEFKAHASQSNYSVAGITIEPKH